MFDPTSRYARLANLTYNGKEPDGAPRVIVYKERRFLPPPDAGSTVIEHTFTQGDRLDNVTAQYIGDPTQYWRVCDANDVMRPSELEQVGKVIRIALPGVS